MKKKKILTMTMVKNEADIIEIFVRYTLSFAEKMVFIDNGCTDNTISILRALINEGLNIELYYEADVLHEQYIIENKYLYKILDDIEFDFILPLDADEFLSSDQNLFECIEKLNMDSVSLLKWRTYVLTENRENKKIFFDEIKTHRINESITFTKVIIPSRIVKEKEIFIKNGHHLVESNKPVKQIESKSLFIAHYPVRSQEQIQSKIYQGAISQLLSSYSKVVAFHWSDIYHDMRTGDFDLIKYSLTYALPKGSEVDIKKDTVENKINLSHIDEIVVKYSDLATRNILSNMISMMEIISIRSLIGSKCDEDKERVLIFGTGKTAEGIFDFINKSKYNILAYIDSDIYKELSVFENKIVISPSKVKFISYDFIVIASNMYDEILKILLSEGIEITKIKKKSYFLEKEMNN